MKRLVSILLTSVLLLNVFGYSGVFLGLHFQNERSMAKTLDSESFDESATITLKVPMSVPYMPDQWGFEKVSGKFEHHGELYRMVKQMYAKDTLTIICIKDVGHKKINRALSDYAKAISDTATDHRSTKAPISFLKEYLTLVFSIRPVSSGWSATVDYNQASQILLDTFCPSISHPPEPI